MGIRDDRHFSQATRANNTFSEGVGLENVDLKRIENEKRREKRKRKTEKDRILEEIAPLYLTALNSGYKWTNVYNELIADYILTKLKDEKKK